MDLNLLLSIIGAVGGVGGAVAAYMSYRASIDLKVHDLRLQLKIVNLDLRKVVGEQPALMERCSRSRDAIDAATGSRRSGNHEAWEAQMARDRDELEALEAALPPLDMPQSLPMKQLVSLIADTHALKRRAEKLRDDYLAAYAEDDARRDRLHADQRAITAAKMNRPPKSPDGSGR